MEEEVLETNSELELARRYVEQTNTNIFLTGKAGTGKTTFLRQLREESPKRMIVVAPTGVAAINAQGVTIHSFFQLPFSPFIEGRSMNGEKDKYYKFSKKKQEIIRSLDLLIIDEISMVRADLLDAIDNTLRRYRKIGRHLPFGGVQLLMIGDLQQLPPVYSDEEWQLLRYTYDTPYFFSSIALRKSNFVRINLQKVFRQKDEIFIELLNEIRNNTISDKLINRLNERSNVDFDPSEDNDYIILCTHNYQAQKINENKLKQLDYASYTFKATITGDFPETSFPNEFELELKKDAQIMFVKNDVGEMSKRKYYNGKIGRIVDIDHDRIIVRSNEGSGEEIVLNKYTWNNYRYSINNETNEIEEESIGTFEQYPIKLAWAITIHKSQGLTFDKVIIDSNKAFASGQVYVALSRCRTLEGIILTSPFNPESIIVDKTLIDFDKEQEENIPNKDDLEKDSISYFEESLLDLFSFRDILWAIEELKKENNTNYYKIYKTASERINQLIKNFETDIWEIGLKFENHIKKLLKDGITTHVEERLIKAKEYFIDKFQILDTIIAILKDMEFDNKDTNRLQKSIQEGIKYELYLKKSLFAIIDKGFDFKDYLAKKNKLLIKDAKTFISDYELEYNLSNIKTKDKIERMNDAESRELNIEILNSELYEALREWRNFKAKEENIPAYLVLKQISLIEIANKMPKTEKELRNIKGIGDKKMQQFGEEVLEIIKGYIDIEN